MPFKKKDKTKVDAPAVVTPVIPTIESPKVIAFSVEKDKGLWRLVLSELQDSKVVGRKVIECENRAHALERFKIKFAELYFIGR